MANVGKRGGGHRDYIFLFLRWQKAGNDPFFALPWYGDPGPLLPSGSNDRRRKNGGGKEEEEETPFLAFSPSAPTTTTETKTAEEEELKHFVSYSLPPHSHERAKKAGPKTEI